MGNAIKQNIGKKYTSKDYIQTGLIAQWDGIENAGYNKHNHDITQWKDLVGNRDIGVTEVYKDSTFRGNYNATEAIFSFNGDLSFGGRFLYSGSSWDKWCYLGIGRDDGCYNGIIISGNNGLNCRYQDKYSNPQYNTFIKYSTAKSETVYTCYVVFHYADKTFDFYVDGQIVGTSQIDIKYWNLDGMRVRLGYGVSYYADIPKRRFNALVYDRALEPWEISHNYDIDLKRFEYTANKN